MIVMSSCNSLLSKNYCSFAVNMYLSLAFWTPKINVIKLILAHVVYECPFAMAHQLSVLFTLLSELGFKSCSTSLNEQNEVEFSHSVVVGTYFFVVTLFMYPGSHPTPGPIPRLHHTGHQGVSTGRYRTPDFSKVASIFQI